MSNPLLEKQILPAFSRIKPDDIKPAIKTIIKDNKESIEKLLQEKKKLYLAFTTGSARCSERKA